MKSLWLRVAIPFNALELRERILVLVAVLAVLTFVIYQFGIAPLQARQAGLARQVAQAQTELTQLARQIDLLTAEAHDVDDGLRRRVAEVRARIAEADAKMRAFEQTLVPPERIPVLLQDLLAKRSGLRLVALRSIPVSPLVERSSATGADGKPIDARAEKTRGETSKANAELAVYKHGVEISVEGRYADLLDYLAELESAGSRLYWSSVSLRVGEYPTSTLSVRLYTLSLEATWLRV